jgi:hypothetical protein
MDKFDLDIESHDTRALLVHPLLGRPQLVGNSRHISGAFSIQDLEWDEQGKRLSGISETIRGEQYSVFIYVPAGMNILKATAETADGSEVKITSSVSGNMLKISIEGEGGQIRWKAGFTNSSR